LHLKRLPVILSLLAVASVLYFFSEPILWKLGSLLVLSEPPQKADLIEVPGGDYAGNRILKACELLRAGYAPKAFVTGESMFYGVHESKLAIDFAGTRGCPPNFFLSSDYPAVSTFSELKDLITRLPAMGVHKVLLVTSPSHTARATRVFRRLAPNLEIHTVASFDPKWNNGYWWKTREGRKVWFFESVKTIADYLGI
jgi:uncharacterized SAM-binding protein YcdF (DUF218 family)